MYKNYSKWPPYYRSYTINSSFPFLIVKRLIFCFWLEILKFWISFLKYIFGIGSKVITPIFKEYFFLYCFAKLNNFRWPKWSPSKLPIKIIEPLWWDLILKSLYYMSILEYLYLEWSHGRKKILFKSKDWPKKSK